MSALLSAKVATYLEKYDPIAVPTTPEMVRLQFRLLEMLEARCWPPAPRAEVKEHGAWELTSFDYIITVAEFSNKRGLGSQYGASRWSGTSLNILVFSAENDEPLYVRVYSYTNVPERLMRLASLGALVHQPTHRQLKQIQRDLGNANVFMEFYNRPTDVFRNILGDRSEFIGALIAKGVLQWEDSDETVDSLRASRDAKAILDTWILKDSHVTNDLLTRGEKPWLRVLPPRLEAQCPRCRRTPLKEPHKGCKLCKI